MASEREWEARHRARVQKATHNLRARLERREEFVHPAPNRTDGGGYARSDAESIIVPSYQCFICQKEAESGVLLPESIVFYFCKEHRASGYHLAENAWRDYREKRESERIRGLMRERTEQLWMLLLQGLSQSSTESPG